MKIFILTLSIFIELVAHDICITNFNKEICGGFKVFPSVIVKSTLKKGELKNILKKELKQIAFLKENNIYLIDSNNSLEYAKELSKRDYIIYAQPNILQLREQNSKEIQNIKEQYNLKEIWKKTKGEGVKIAIIDDGFNLNHEDLKGVNVAFSYDSEQKNLNSNSKEKIDTHGTRVVGVIFARHNGIGVDGIAPKAKLIAIRQVSNITSDTIISFTVASKAGADIINCSWNSPILLEPIYDMIVDLAKYGREGKGVAIVFSAGNNHKEIKPYSIEASIEEVITVGATQRYSNYGKVVDFIIPSGIKSTFKDRYNYFGGTSATAPIISGLLALKMSQEPTKSTNELITELKKDINEQRREK